ncbi:MAG TPA: hypothetical protein VGM90_34290 [Kofleriaceae bacterium]|jgi:hypothetical protein
MSKGRTEFSLRPKADTVDPGASGSIPRLELETLTLRSALHSLIASRGWQLADNDMVQIGLAGHDQLEGWYVRALDAQSVEQIFGR